MRKSKKQKGGDDNYTATRYIYGEQDPSLFNEVMIDSHKQCFSTIGYLSDDEIVNMLFNPYTDLWIVTDKNNAYVAHASINYAGQIGNLIGFPFQNDILRPDEKFNLIWNVCIHSGYRGRKICQMLIGYIIENNPNELPFALNVLPGNHSAIKCYEKNGFKLFSQTPDMNVMTTGYDDSRPMEVEVDICDSMASLKIKSKFVFVHILGHGALLPLPLPSTLPLLQSVAERARPLPAYYPIFPQIFGNTNMQNAAVGDRRTEIYQFPFFLPKSRISPNHNMHIIQAETGCISIGPILLDEMVTNMMAKATTSESINLKKALKELTLLLNENVNRFVDNLTKVCEKNPSAINYSNVQNIRKVHDTTNAPRIKYDHIFTNQSSIKCVAVKDVFKSVENWPDGTLCGSAAASKKTLQTLQTQQNNKIYSRFNEAEENYIDKFMYDQIIEQCTDVVSSEIKPFLAHDNQGPLVKLLFSNNDREISLIVPTYFNITLTDILNRVSFLLAGYGIDKSEMIIVDNSCSLKDPDTWAFAGGKRHTRKDKVKRKKRTVRRRKNLARR